MQNDIKARAFKQTKNSYRIPSVIRDTIFDEEGAFVSFL